MANILEPTTRY